MAITSQTTGGEKMVNGEFQHACLATHDATDTSWDTFWCSYVFVRNAKFIEHRYNIYYNSVPTCFSWKKTKRSPTNVHLYTCVMCPYSKVPPPICFNLQISKLLFLGGKGKVKGKSKRPTGDLVAGRE